MGLDQWRGECYATTGDLYTCLVGNRKRRSDCDGVDRDSNVAVAKMRASENDRCHNGRLTVSTTVDGNGLASPKTICTGNRDNCRTYPDCSLNSSAPRCADNRDNGSFAFRACTNNNLLTDLEVCYIGDFDIV
jgi:hypothetical protein